MVSDNFTPVTGFTGGALIGLSAGTLLLLCGEILGASGIVTSVLLHPRKALTDPTMAWKLVFLSVFLLLSNTALAKYFTDGDYDDPGTGTGSNIPIVSTYGYLIGGLFVGFGTKMGNGCTSGHGICGMARFSKRSIVAVCTFMITAIATASIVAPQNKVFASGTAWLRTDTPPTLFNRWIGFTVIMVIIVIPSCVGLFNLSMTSRKHDTQDESGTSCPKEGASLQQLPSCCDNNRKPSIHEPSEFTVMTLEEEHSSATLGHVIVPPAEVTPSKDDNTSKAITVVDEGIEGRANNDGNVNAAVSEEIHEVSPPIDQGDIECCPTNDVMVSPDNHPSNDANDNCCITPTTTTTTTTPTPLRDDSVMKLLPSALSSALFAVGLAVSGMVLPSKVLGFLNLFTISTGTYDPTLLTVMVGGCIVSMVSYQFVESYSLIRRRTTTSSSHYCPCRRMVLDKPICGNKFSIPCNTIIDVRLIGGAVCFGIGWAVAGICPGPAMFLAASGTKPVLACWWPMFIVGSYGAEWLINNHQQRR